MVKVLLDGITQPLFDEIIRALSDDPRARALPKPNDDRFLRLPRAVRLEM
jgi:hypothetical protein